ncbi:alkaline-phosphatase-like protein [Chaetomium strumarium]|uniref:beta-glucosidase n=1 Tax=Chaetomium strumarium TaxID=1170767 RepID=A0AAJ0GMQ4_9PEZI|nr:alkaline-phosphatase-like protein [Chaetomium strumarium]
MVGKWHMGEAEENYPTGFDYWSILPGQGDYWDPEFIEPSGINVEEGYVTDIITEKSLNWMRGRDRTKPFFLMCHHKAPHRSWECDDKHKDLYKDPVRLPDTFTDDYKSRAKAAKVAKMRVAEDLTYQDLGLVQPDGGRRVGERVQQEKGASERKIPAPTTAEGLGALKLIDKDDGTVFTFTSQGELAEFKFQRYMQRYLRTIQSVDDSVGRLLDYLDHDEPGLTDDTIVIYTSDQGFFLGEHGWFDKRFMYEESFQMPFLIKYPQEISPGSVCDDIICNVDFATTWLDYARLPVPSYMQGRSFRPLLQGRTPAEWPQAAYHRYWMHNDIIHNAYAHYGIRDQRYKLIYWYNEALGIKGARSGGEEHKEWELFDCEKDPLELFNVYHEPEYREVVRHMTALLEKKMLEIGDEPVHPKPHATALGISRVSMVSIRNAALSALALAATHCDARQRAKDLLKQMTWEEKIGQMGGVRRVLSSGTTVNPQYDTIRQMQNGQMGFGPMFNWAGDIMEVVNKLRQEQVNSSRLHVPYITVTDSVNGLFISGGTVFPSNLAMSASFNLPLFKSAIEAIREEQLSIGVRWVLSPSLDLAREPRYGRIGELFGEDGYLIGEFGRVYVETMEEEDGNGYTKVACTIKHFVFGDPRGGVNTASQYGGLNHLFNDQLRPYLHVLETTKPASLMVSYATVDLVPMSANEYMLQDILRARMGFEGLIMSDAYSIPNLYTQSMTATSLEDAAIQALHAGLQMELAPAGSPAVFPTLLSSVKDKKVAKLIDEAALKMLEIKFGSGVFEQPLADLDALNTTLRAPAHLDVARQMAREGIVLLKNDGLLPVTPNKVAVIGPFGDIINAGSYAAVNSTDPQYGNSLYRSAVSAFGANKVTFARGCDFVDTTDDSGIATAVAAAKEAGLAVVMIGSLSAPMDDTILAAKRTDGEFFAHADLGFPGLQQQLLDAILDAGVPTVLVLSGGQPFVLDSSTLRANAIFHSFLGGEFTGDALVELLTGAVNPSGKLTISMPQHSAAVPAMYDYLPSDDQGGSTRLLGYHSAWQFPNLTRTVPMPFGYGLSYTTFDIAAPVAKVQGSGSKAKEVVVSITVKNTGARKGQEVVQLYFRPATTRGLEFPVRRLVRFEKVDLEAGESRELAFTIPYKDLGLWINAKLTTQLGLYHLWAGSSSREEDLKMGNVTLT